MATDGSCLIHTPNDTASIEGAAGNLILPRDFVEALVKTKQKSTDLSVSDGLVVSGMFRCTPVDGVYPDWHRVIPTAVSGEVAQFNVDVLAKLAAANKALGMKHYGCLIIEHNGKGSALVKLQSGCVGVAMPFTPSLDGPTD